MSVALMAALQVAWQVVSSRVGLPLVVAAALIIFYEGLPIGPLRYIPWAGHYLAMVVDGRVDRVREQARIDIENESRARAMALIEKRNQDNAEITDLDAAHLCVELGGRWIDRENRCD